MRLRTQLLTKNECYIAGKTIKPKGVMVHSTGANNPNVSRYVPGDGEIGRNKNGNHWNQPGIKKCVHAFVGKFADGGVGTVQTLPWNRRGWHGASGKKGSSNDTHIGFEICEDGLEDRAYFNQVYLEAVELTAMLCRAYKLDPLKDGVVICHQEGYRRGIASNHGDVLHWFPKHGKSMDDFRADVARLVKGAESMTEEQVKTIARAVCAQLMELDSYPLFVRNMERYREELGKLPTPNWAQTEHELARAAGFTDGTRPCDFPTRQEVFSMVLRALKK